MKPKRRPFQQKRKIRCSMRMMSGQQHNKYKFHTQKRKIDNKENSILTIFFKLILFDRKIKSCIFFSWIKQILNYRKMFIKQKFTNYNGLFSKQGLINCNCYHYNTFMDQMAVV